MCRLHVNTVVCYVRDLSAYFVFLYGDRVLGALFQDTVIDYMLMIQAFASALFPVFRGVGILNVKHTIYLM